MERPLVTMPGSELGRHRWRVLSLTSVGMFMGTLDATIVSVALPALGPSLKLSYSEALWVQAGYLLMLSILLIPIGRMADMRGLLRFFLSGAAVFGVFSLVCAFSFTGGFLIAARCLQGAGAAFLSATSPALVTTAFPPQQRGRVLGLNAMAGYLGLMVGPPVGGLIVTHFGWRWIFLINVPISMVILFNAWSMLGMEKRDRAASRARAKPETRLDWLGSSLLGVTLAALLLPLILVPFWGWSSPQTIGLLAAFVALLVGFVLVESRVSNPVLDLDLVRRNRGFAAGNFAALLNYAAVYGITVFSAVFLEVTRGYTAQRAGLVLLTQPIFMAGLSPVFGRLSDRIGSRLPATGGMLLGAVGMVLLATLPQSVPIWRMVLALAVVGIGMAAFSSPNTSSVMGSVKRTQLSLASGFLGTMRSAGQGLSVALLGAIAASGLGPTGGRVLLLGEAASRSAADEFAKGYRTAMYVSVGLAVVGAMVSTVRGRPGE